MCESATFFNKNSPQNYLIFFKGCVNPIANALPQNSKAIDEFYICSY